MDGFAYLGTFLRILLENVFLPVTLFKNSSSNSSK